MKTYLITFLSLFILSTATAQLPGSGVSTQSGVLDGVYIQEHIPTKRVVQYAHLREADVMWGKRVWRTLDMREKMNHKLYYPLEKLSDRLCLYDIIKYGALEEGSLTIYDLNGLDLDDKFRFPVRPSNGNVTDPEYKKRLEGFFGYAEERDSIDNDGNVAIDDDGNDIKIEEITPYEAREIIQYKIKEDWFFDKQRSVLDVRIIGLAPVVYSKNPLTQEIFGLKTLFWLYFPECRYVFQNFFVYNPENDAQRMSFDDLFWKREFSSYINKESNVFDRSVSPNYEGLDALLESEKIRNEIFLFEHDLWHF
ncbi:MAG: gliding motility protein GldN [Bacteroidota bacterium]|nr:gliding motility protein GldN [Bacteroidota bacterium]